MRCKDVPVTGRRSPELAMRNTILSVLVAFYKFWHGTMRLRGAGALLRSFARASGAASYRLRVPGVGVLTIDPRDPSGTGWINYGFGETGNEEGLLIAVANLGIIRPVIWDIGANAGMIILAIARHLPDYEEIQLFEPNPSLIPTLVSLADHLPRLTVNRLALSDQAGTAILHVPYNDSSTASFDAIKHSRPVHTRTVSGDAYIAETGQRCPDIIIIDTEGHDCQVILGLREAIERNQPVIFFEHIFVTEDDMWRALPAGYRQFTVDDESGELLPGLHRQKGHNSMLAPQAFH